MPPQPKKKHGSSFIDLTICDLSIFLDFSWNPFNDTCRSDHYPIILNNKDVIHDHIPSRENWGKFHELCSRKHSNN